MIAYVIEHKLHYIVDNSIGFFVRACEKSFEELGFTGIKNCYQILWQMNKIDLPPYVDSDKDNEFGSSSEYESDAKPSPKRARSEDKDEIVPGTCDVDDDDGSAEDEEESQVHDLCE